MYAELHHGHWLASLKNRHRLPATANARICAAEWVMNRQSLPIWESLCLTG